MVEAAIIVRLVRASTTTFEEAVKLVETFGEAEAYRARVDELDRAKERNDRLFKKIGE